MAPTTHPSFSFACGAFLIISTLIPSLFTDRLNSPLKFLSLLLAALSFTGFPSSAHAGVAVWTHHNDNSRTGANLQETVLNTSNVSTSQFGKLFSLPVDGEIYAQPLYLPQVSIPGRGVHNTVLVATMNDSVYAFDADSNSGTNSTPLWEVNFTNPAAGITAIPAGDLQPPDDFNVHGTIGILSTPVIDQTAGTIYVLARTKESGAYFQRLHALNVADGTERPNSPVAITASVAGTGYDSLGGVISFNPLLDNQRAALALTGGVVYIAWASLTDRDPYHGWVIGYDATSLAQVGVYNDTPNGGRGGIWQSGNGPAIGSDGSLFVLSGNGDWDGTSNLGSSMIKLRTVTLHATDYFTPADWNYENQLDLDLGSSGPLLIPGSNLAVGGGKEGILFVVPTGAMGHLQGSAASNVQAFQATIGHIHGAPVYWVSPNNGPLIYVWGEQSPLRAFHFNGSGFDTAPAMQSSMSAPPGMPGASLSLSANASQAGTGIVWAALPSNSNAETADVAGILRAFDASDLTHELWNSLQNQPRDDLGLFAKFAPPTIANGKVYLATFSNQLCVYGLFDTKPDFTLRSTVAGAGVLPGGRGAIPVTVVALNGLSSAVSLGVKGLPAGATASFSPRTITGSGSATLTIRTTSSTPIGAYNLVIAGSAASIVHAFPLKLFVNSVAGTLSESISTPSQLQNLTNAGSSDWIHWGLGGATGLNRKAGVSPAITNFVPVGPGLILSYDNNPFGFAWTDGTPTTSMPFTASGVYVVGANNGFRITAPADLTPRSLTIYAGVYQAQAKLTAALSDFSAARLVDTSVSNMAGQLSVAYTFLYQGASAGQTLSIAITEMPGAPDTYSNVTLQAAVLQELPSI